MAAGFNESSTVQTAIVEQLVDLGWTHIPGKDLPRATDGVLLEEHLTSALKRLNARINEQPERVDEVLPKLRAVLLSAHNDGVVAANERFTTWLRGDRTIRYIGTDTDEPVHLIDFEHLDKNVLVVSDEVTYGPPGHTRRFDIVLWVNGIPIAVGETKSPVNSSVSWLNAARDIHDVYEREVPQFFVPNILSFATEGRELHYGAVGQPGETWLLWGSTTDPHDLDGWPRVTRSIQLLLNPKQLLTVLRDYTLYERATRNGIPTLVKLIPRYPQVEAVEAIHRRVLDPDRRQGLVWHHQGTGKTLLMAFAALRLLHDDDVGGPTVLIVLDRIDLVEQTVAQFRTAGLPRMRVAGTKDQLRRMLREDQRGIIVTTIFRFESAGHLNDRDNIVVLIDEAHRTQEGRLGQDLRTALPNAQFFGLTGTPIADRDRSTFKLFGDANDPGWVLNQYTMERSIADGASVPVHVETRLVDFHVDRERLNEAFDALVDEEQLSDDQRELLASKATSMAAFVRNPDRVAAVCADIVEHFYDKVNPLGMKAQVVAYDREMCVLYEAELNQLLAKRAEIRGEAPDETAVVMFVGTSKSDPPEWSRYDRTREEENELKDRFNDAGDPLKFLIVTAKLLTGFDAPIEGVMYLDRPLRLHTLFQAICRTNRRWQHPKTRQEKRHGLIVDYVGLGNEIGKALRAADPETGGKRPIEIDGLVDELEAALATCLTRFEGIDRTDSTFAALHAAQERIPPGTPREEFAKEFARAQALWEFLHPNPVLDEHRHDYKWLARLYESVRPSGVSDALLWHRLGAKTLTLVHEHISDVSVTGTGLDEIIVDQETIEAIRQLSLPDTSTPTMEGTITVQEALDTIEARLKRRLNTSGHAVYQGLAERLERLRQASLERAEASVEFLREILALAKDLTAAERAEDQGGTGALSLLPDPKIGALTQILDEYRPSDTPVIIEEVVGDIDAIVKEVRFAGWADTQNGDRTVRKEIRLVLKRYGLPTTGELFDRTYAYIRENY